VSLRATCADSFCGPRDATLCEFNGSPLNSPFKQSVASMSTYARLDPLRSRSRAGRKSSQRRHLALIAQHSLPHAPLLGAQRLIEQ
jgi:hypothetical protein